MSNTLLQFLIVLGGLALLLWTEQKSKWISFILLAFTFILTTALKLLPQDIANFYLILLLVYGVSLTAAHLFQIEGLLKRSPLPFWQQMGLGVLVIGAMYFLQGIRGDQFIIGTPKLALLTSAHTLFGPLLAGYLGAVENRAWMALFYTILQLKDAFAAVFLALFGWIPWIGTPLTTVTQLATNVGIFLPTVITMVSFAIAHVVVYQLALGAIIFAMLVMGVWTYTHYKTRSMAILDLAHYFWNAFRDLARSV